MKYTHVKSIPQSISLCTMLSDYQNAQIRQEIYRGTLNLLLEQIMITFSQATSLGILLDLETMIDTKFRTRGMSFLSTSLQTFSRNSNVVLTYRQQHHAL